MSFWHIEYAIELAEAIGKYNSVHLVLLKDRVKQTVGETAISSLGPNVHCSLISYKTLRHLSVLKILSTIFGIVSRFKPDVIHLSTCMANAKPDCPYASADQFAAIIQEKTGIPVVEGTHDYH